MAKRQNLLPKEIDENGVNDLSESSGEDSNKRSKKCQEFKLCKDDNCSLETVISRHSDQQEPEHTCAFVLTTVTDKSIDRHERCHSVCIQFDTNLTGMSFHAAATHNTGRLYALYELQKASTDDEDRWVKIKTNV